METIVVVLGLIILCGAYCAVCLLECNCCAECERDREDSFDTHYVLEGEVVSNPMEV